MLNQQAKKLFGNDPDLPAALAAAMEAEHRISFTIVNTFDEMLTNEHQKYLASIIVSAALIVKFEASKQAVPDPAYTLAMDALITAMRPYAVTRATQVRDMDMGEIERNLP